MAQTLGEAELSVLEVLASRAGSVVSRPIIRRLAGLRDLSERRCDSAIVSIRKVLGEESIVTVRSRGWMLQQDYLDAAVQTLETMLNQRDDKRK